MGPDEISAYFFQIDNTLYMKPIPELQSLLEAVEKKYGAPIRTTSDFERLSAAMEYALPESLGATTLKRLWGYIPGQTTPRLTTLDLLARYAGYKSFKQFCGQMHAEDSSDFIANRSCLTTADLEPGDSVTIGWAPNRLARLEYKGDSLFEVVEVANARLQTGDVIEVSCFFEGWPLFVPGILRNGAMTPPYIAGKAHGLTLIKKDPLLK